MTRLQLALLAAPAAAAGSAAAGVAVADAWPWLALLCGAAAAMIAAAAAMLTHHHFDALGRLGDILSGLAAGAGTRAPAPVLDGADDAVAAAYRGGLALYAAREAERRRSGATAAGERLGQIVAALPQAVLVLTENGLVSLANGAARRLFAGRSVLPGTSVFDALDRGQIGDAVAQAREAGQPVEAVLKAVDGRRLRVQVSALGRGDGSILLFAPAGPREATPWEPGLDQALDLHDHPPPPGAIDPRTPLSDLPVAVLDTETTGLDPTRDRVVAVGVVRLHGHRLYPSVTLDELVRPGIPIPATATAVHGIDDAMVAGAPTLEAILPQIADFIGGCVVLGHNIGFDLAVLEAEAARSGAAWRRPPAFCLLQLADALDPGRTDLDLDGLAQRLAVPVTGRHTALGDALLAGEIYLRLLPRLAGQGVTDWGGLTALAVRARRVRRLQAEAGW